MNDSLYVISLRCTLHVHVAQSKFTRWEYDLKWSTIINFAKCVFNKANNRGRVDKG
jgi:hypothetical protein